MARRGQTVCTDGEMLLECLFVRGYRYLRPNRHSVGGQPYYILRGFGFQEMIEGLKPLYERILRPAIRLFQRLGIRPNHLTVAGMVLFGVAGWYCAVGRWYVAVVVVVVASLTDGWDGLLARETGQKTEFGGILDSTCDRVAEALLVAGLLVYYERTSRYSSLGVYLSYAAMAASFMVSYVKARCEGQGVACRGGVLQRPERIILLCVLLLLGPRAMLYGLGGLSALAFFTVFQRAVIGYRACARVGAQCLQENRIDEEV